jgi:DNA-directed RNA polymerase subunit RPC12/RpoP
MTTSHDCPNCGANIRDDGVSDFVGCRFCGTRVAIPRVRRAASRRELEAERDQILARENEWGARLKQANAHGLEDFIVPPIGCCGIYFALFVAGSLILSAIGVQASRQYGTAVAGIAVLAALIGVVLIIWRREARRREGVVALERERTADRGLREERLREIEAELEALGD